jgi:hypothetical protein
MNDIVVTQVYIYNWQLVVNQLLELLQSKKHVFYFSKTLSHNIMETQFTSHNLLKIAICWLNSKLILTSSDVVWHFGRIKTK